jgi:ribose transport system permease protein
VRRSAAQQKELQVSDETTMAATRPTVTEASPRGGGLLARAGLARDYAIVICVVALFIVLAASSDTFLTSTNLLNVLAGVAPTGIVAFAITFLLIVGEFDLSAGAIFVLTGVLSAKLYGDLGVWPAILVALAAATALGVMNGILVAYFRINSFVCTLATSLMMAGLGLVITKGFLLNVPNEDFAALGTNELLGVKWAIWLLVIAALLSGFVLTRTKFGRWLYAVGGNPEAARLSGINVQRMKLAAFAISGFAAGVGGAIVVSRTSTGQAGDGITVVFAAFAAVVVGGTSVAGGRGAIWRTVLGVLFLALITNGFNLLEVDVVYQSIIQGAIILLAVAADSLSRRGG